MILLDFLIDFLKVHKTIDFQSFHEKYVSEIDSTSRKKFGEKSFSDNKGFWKWFFQKSIKQYFFGILMENSIVHISLVSATGNYITWPKVGNLNFCSGFRWTAVLESVQRNPLTNAVTLQSIPLFWLIFCSEFRCKALDSTIKYLKHSDLAVESTKQRRGFHWTLQWTPPMAAVESTIDCSGLHCSVLVEFTELLQYQPTKTINHREVAFMHFSAWKFFLHEFSFENGNIFRISKGHKKKNSEFLHLANDSQRVFVNQAPLYCFSLTVIFSFFDWIIVGMKISHTVLASYLVIHTYH